MQIRRRTPAKLLLAVFAINLVVMGAGAYLASEQSPPIPTTVTGPDGETAVAAAPREGKTVFQRDGLTNHGSILGDESDAVQLPFWARMPGDAMIVLGTLVFGYDVAEELLHQRSTAARDADRSVPSRATTDGAPAPLSACSEPGLSYVCLISM